jgi:hypothetical protein
MSRPARRSSPLFLIAVSLVLTGALVTGCAQKEGERCERNEDCEGELLCLNKTAAGGVCRPRGFQNPADAAAGGDTAPEEVAAETPLVEAATEAAPETAPDAATDAGADTVGTPDAGSDVRLDASAG